MALAQRAPSVAPDEASAASSAEDERFMRDALLLGQRNLGRTFPNPSVGAVVVRRTSEGPIVVGRGTTQPGGRPHAETQALHAAGDATRGATLYVSLEPCAHHGKTPPCADAVIAAGIARVVSALEDANPRVAGEGHRRLRAAGIVVSVGTLASEAARAHRGHLTRVRIGRPSVMLKLARTSDGYAARTHGPRLMITAERTNDRMQLLRAHADAILVGVGTVLTDDPRLTVRLPGLAERSPLRVVLDSRLRTPPDGGLVATARETPTLIITAAPPSSAAAEALEDKGVEILQSAASGDGRVDVRAALVALGGRGITRVFCEGGPRLAEALAAEDLVDELVLATSAAPLGTSGVPALGPSLSALIRERRLETVESIRLGADTLAHLEKSEKPA